MDQDRENQRSEYHEPVLAAEVVEIMTAVVPGVIVDATFGGGGHTRRMLGEFGDKATIVGVDRDPEALENARDLPITVIQANFDDLASAVDTITDEDVSGVLFDFGVSSHQLDEPSRGFSYHGDGPLDMRMGPDASFTAHEIVNTWSAHDLARLIRSNAEEPLAGRIARAIVAARPIDSTAALSTTIAEAMPAARRRAGHPARRTFQAIRMAVNAELEAVEAGLGQAVDMVRVGGRVAAISYHSLEDRITKRLFADRARGCTCPPDLPVCGCGNTAQVRVLTRKPIRPSDAEVARNNRSRSAVLRAVEKVAA